MTDAFQYRGGTLFCDDVDLDALAAQYGTPAYVYSARMIRARYREYNRALEGLPHRICYAVKANSTLAILHLLAREGAGFDIVSGGELHRVIAAGGHPSQVVFSGVGKTEAEIRYALTQRIHSFNCESQAEIETISRLAVETNTKASVGIRVNPDVDAATHPYISTGLREHKFGVDISEAEQLYIYAGTLPGLILETVSCHIGSQLLTVDPLLEAAGKVLGLIERLRSAGVPIRNLDLGGGLGVPYRSGDRAVPIGDFLSKLKARIAASGLTLFLEPGRSIVGQAGVLLSRVVLTKDNGAKTFVVLDAGMNDLIRPALYQAHHEIVTVREPCTPQRRSVEVVGPVCESADFFARDRHLPPLTAGDLVAVCTTGAYGFVLASNYNSRPRACELLIEGSRIHLARARETFDDLLRGESVGDTEQVHERPARDFGTRPT